MCDDFAYGCHRREASGRKSSRLSAVGEGSCEQC
jgi:hypothetical protein